MAKVSGRMLHTCDLPPRKCQVRIFEPLKHLLAIFHMIRDELRTPFLIFRFVFLLIRTPFYRNIIQEWRRDVRDARFKNESDMVSEDEDVAPDFFKTARL